MILHQNSIIKLDYNPATDILQVDYPDLHTFHLPEISESLVLLVETIRNYDVKRLLLDASKTIIEVSEEQNKQLTLQLASDLQKTRIQKVARIQPLDQTRELTAQENIKRIQQAGLLSYQIQTFISKDEALAWLKKNEN